MIPAPIRDDSTVRAARVRFQIAKGKFTDAARAAMHGDADARAKANAALERALAQTLALLGEHGRLVAISFHSLEDRIVKRFMAREARGDEAYAGMPNIPPHARPRLTLVGKLVRPDAAELERNPRARSARLRVAERTALVQAA